MVSLILEKISDWQIYLIVTVLSRIVEPSVAVVIPPEEAAPEPPLPFFAGMAFVGMAERRKTSEMALSHEILKEAIG